MPTSQWVRPSASACRWDKYIANKVTKNEAFGLDFTDCWDGNDNRKDNGDAAAAAWKTIADAGMEGICIR